ncbi:MarR family winged helix-turn-helix transcriptional regulator [Clostridium felsineum]|uniref:Transcriptional regulator SlyA n=1 Tax=Clostridium felsineum TaxID=36839 RepID=A0A1S8LZU5_9CLOT|nr:MarR family transcriptional regulator [Clostridium felsineum]URZ05066.1 Transcriptional regulator SlyA [Clostridium felsineum]URZ10107.1 Transcriptional regulator SlyA [Clostridium felsineum]
MKSLDKSLGMYINYINRKMLRLLSSKLKSYNITTEQWSVLINLVEKDGINQKHLASTVDKDQATLVRILDILEKKNLATRKKCSEDRRSFLIYSTEEGKALEAKVYPIIEDLFKNIINGISKDQLILFLNTLSTLEKNISIEEEKIHGRNSRGPES